MTEMHTLGKVEIKAGELITFTFDDTSLVKRQRLSVVALNDFNMSQEMALFYQSTDRSTDIILTENALPKFIEWLCEKGYLHVSTEVSVHVGTIGRPAVRLADEHRFMLNPESFWTEKLNHRYTKNSFNVYNSQDHLLTIMMDVDAPFTIIADIIDLTGEHLGILQLSVLSNNRYTTLSEEDLEVIRSALQADISLYVKDIAVLVDRISLLSNPDFGKNAFAAHLDKPDTITNKD